MPHVSPRSPRARLSSSSGRARSYSPCRFATTPMLLSDRASPRGRPAGGRAPCSPQTTPCRDRIALLDRRNAATIPRPWPADRGRLPSRWPAAALQPAAPLAEVASQRPEAPQRPPRRRAVSASPPASSQPSAARKLSCSSFQLGPPGGLLRPAQLRLRPFGQRQVVGRRAAGAGRRLAAASRRSSANSRIVSSIVEARLARRAAPPAAAGSCRPATPARPARRSRGRRPSPQTASAASSVQPPTKTASRRNSALLGRVEQVVAPGDRAAQRLLAGRQVARAAGQQRQPAAPAAPAAPAGESSATRAAASSIASGRPSRRAQISATAGGVLVREREVRLDGLRPLDEQRHRRDTATGARRRRQPLPARAAPAAAPGTRARRGAQQRPAGDQHLQPRRGRQQVGHHRRGRQHLLEVVEQQQQRAVVKELLEVSSS